MQSPSTNLRKQVLVQVRILDLYKHFRSFSLA